MQFSQKQASEHCFTTQECLADFNVAKAFILPKETEAHRVKLEKYGMVNQVCFE